MKTRLVAIAIAFVLCVPVSALAQAKPLPNRVKQIVQSLYDRNVSLSEGTDDQRRALAKMIAEQTTCELGPEWGWKSASPTRPPSKDAIAHKIDGGKMDGWDLFNGSTRKPNGGLYVDLTGQHFLPVSKVDHLGVGCAQTVPPPPGEEPEPPPPTGSELARLLEEQKKTNAILVDVLLAQVIARLDALVEAQNAERAAMIQAIRELQTQVATGVRVKF